MHVITLEAKDMEAARERDRVTDQLDPSLGQQIQGIRLVCTLDGTRYKEYELLLNEQPLGVVSWDTKDAPIGHWYTTAKDGNLRYFQTLEEVVDFLKGEPSLVATKLSSQLKAKLKALLSKLNTAP